MASDDFNRANESPLASPWGAWGSFTTCRLVGNAVQNSSGDGDSGCIYGSSTVADSQWTYVSGTTDGGPGVEMATGPNGYAATAYDATRVYIFEITAGSYDERGATLGVYVAGQPVRLRRSGSNLILSVNAVDLLTVADTTFSGTGKPGALFYAGNLVMYSWTDNAGGTAYSLTMANGTYALAGQAAGLRAARRMTAEAGSYALAGQAALVRLGRKLVAETGIYAVNGQDVTLQGPTVGYSLTMDAGAYALLGSDAAADYAITLQSGSYSVSGQDVRLVRSGSVLAEQGSYELNGQDLGMRVARTLPLESGTYELNGIDAGLSQHDPSPSLVMETGVYNLIGQQVGLFGPGDSNADIFRNLPLNWWTK